MIRVKGKNKPVRIFEIIERKTNKLNNTQKARLEYYLKGLENYRNREFLKHFESALAIFPQDGPSNEFLQRCQHYLQSPPPDSWDGVFDLKSK